MITFHSAPLPPQVAETVQHFITAMDALKLRMVAVDQLCPILSDLITSMSKVQSLPLDFAPKVSICQIHCMPQMGLDDPERATQHFFLYFRTR